MRLWNNGVRGLYGTPPLRRAVELDRREEYSDMGWLKVSGEEIRG